MAAETQGSATTWATSGEPMAKARMNTKQQTPSEGPRRGDRNQGRKAARI
jgi:hypothetical protein